jgi:hypothetical protein
MSIIRYGGSFPQGTYVYAAPTPNDWTKPTYPGDKIEYTPPLTQEEMQEKVEKVINKDRTVKRNKLIHDLCVKESLTPNEIDLLQYLVLEMMDE